MIGFLKRLAGDRRGGVGALSVLVSVLVVTGTAATVDAASVHFRARALQGLADTAAVSAASNLGTAETTVQRVLNLKESAARIETVALGQYHRRADVPIADRFNATATEQDAVRVVLEEDVNLFFGSVLGIDAIRVRKAAVAIRPARDTAAFSIGSRLLALDPPLVNSLLSQLIGREVQLTALSYDSLLSSSLDVDALLQDLTQSLSVDDRDSLLAHTVSLQRLVNSMANVTTGQTRVALQSLSTTLGTAPARNLRLDALIDVAPGVTGTVNAKVPVWDLLNAALGEAVGPKTVELDVNVNSPVTAKVRVAIGEREQKSAWLTIARDGTTIVRTAQARLHVDVTTLNLTGIGKVHLPVYAEVASGKAALAAIDCGADTFDVTARSGVASVALGEIESSRLSDFSRDAALTPAAILDSSVVKVRAAARINVADSGDRTLKFNRADIDALSPKTIGSGSVLASTIGSLAANTSLDIQLLGLGIALPGLPGQLRTILGDLVSPLDAVLEQVMQLLGLGIGEADIRPAGLQCGHRSAPPTLAA
ncbi:TadG family pilus assembly protein [Brevundimonas sp. FT23028]|uniref:TadG family pilus assembly protein n=1 Tax=Brevundimonas sp. FT23028 TaxID=3393748 RepID=UPI003B58974E